MKVLVRSLLLILVVFFVGCARNEVKLTFELPADVNSPCRILYYASGKKGGVIRETVAEINAGKGEIILPTQYPALIYLFSPSSKIPAALIYAERGDKIVVAGKSADVSEWEIKGNKVTEALTQWRIDNISLISSKDSDKLNKVVGEYVARHPDSPAAAIILYFYFDRRGHEKEFVDLQNKLENKVLENERLMDAISMSDLFTQLPMETAFPRQLILTGEEGYADTLLLTKGKAKFLFFRPSGNIRDVIPMDTLKKMAKKDTAGHHIAELYMDSDSLSWRRHVRKDTIPEMSRLWMPLGMLDSVAMSMQVRTLPYYIVVDSKGKEIYRGDDWKEARKKFEKLK